MRQNYVELKEEFTKAFKYNAVFLNEVKKLENIDCDLAMAYMEENLNKWLFWDELKKGR